MKKMRRRMRMNRRMLMRIMFFRMLRKRIRVKFWVLVLKVLIFLRK